MFSSSRKFILPLFVFLSLFLAAAEAHDSLLHRRDHANINMKRLMKKRAPLPQDNSDGGLLGDVVVGAAPVPSETSNAPTSTAATPRTSPTAASATAASSSATSSAASSSAASSSAASSSAVSSSASSSEARSSSVPPSPTETPNAPGTAAGVNTVFVGGGTRTSSVAADTTLIPDQTGNLNKPTPKGTAMTALIAIAASVGGIFIIWTIFRKWKLSSSKEFDRRLNPIDWTPAGDDDGAIPGSNRPRPPSVISNHSNAHGSSAHGHSANPFDDFDGPAKPVGGYADLSRGANPQMQERYGATTYGNNYGAGGVPLHNQGY